MKNLNYPFPNRWWMRNYPFPFPRSRAEACRRAPSSVSRAKERRTSPPCPRITRSRLSTRAQPSGFDSDVGWSWSVNGTAHKFLLETSVSTNDEEEKCPLLPAPSNTHPRIPHKGRQGTTRGCPPPMHDHKIQTTTSQFGLTFSLVHNKHFSTRLPHGNK